MRYHACPARSSRHASSVDIVNCHSRCSASECRAAEAPAEQQPRDAERRAIEHVIEAAREDDELVNAKVRAAFAHGLTPILCVGETEDERERGDTERKLRHQVQEALDKITAFRPSIIISDLVMPRMGGPELAQELLARRPAVKVLYMSGYTAEAIANSSAHSKVIVETTPISPRLGAIAKNSGSSRVSSWTSPVLTSTSRRPRRRVLVHPWSHNDRRQ